VDEGSLIGGTSVGAVSFTAVTLEAIGWQLFKFQDLGKDKGHRDQGD
jgi:hypothetical protein